MNLDTILNGIWRGLEAAPRAAHDGWRLPVVATVDADGLPQARTMVLRDTDVDARRLRFFSDSRGLKITNLANRPLAQLVFYDSESLVQLRASGEVSIVDDARTKEIWQSLSLPARYLYAAEPSPGSQTDEPASGLPIEIFNDDEIASRIVEAHFDNFTIFEVQISRIDWLQLTADGNRAARFEWPGDGPVRASWRIP